MNKVRLATALIPVFVICGPAAFCEPMPGSRQNPMTPEQAISVSSQGQNVSVAGVASVSEAAGLPGIFIKLSSPDAPTPFVGYIDIDNEREFRDLARLAGRTVELTGVVETRGSVPMIELSSPNQIAVLR